MTNIFCRKKIIQFLCGLIIISCAFLIMSSAAFAASYPNKNYTISIDQDDKEVNLNAKNSSAYTVISLPQKAEQIQAVKYKDGSKKRYAVITYHLPNKEKLRMRVYHPNGTWTGTKTPFSWKDGQSVPAYQLNKIGSNEFEVSMIKQNKSGANKRYQKKAYKVRPKQDKKKNVLKRLSADSNVISKPTRTGDDRTDSLALLNYYRAIAGQLPVTENAEYSAGCEKHVAYMHLNQQITHYEDPTKPGYTEEGASTGPSSNLGGGTGSLYENVERWMASVYHRFPMVEPYTQEVGFHYYNNVSCLYFNMNSELYFMDYTPIPFPAPDQTDAFYDFIGYESPDPLDGHVSNPDVEYPVGTVVSLQFSGYQSVDSMSVSLQDSYGNSVYGYTRLPNDDNDPHEIYQRNAVTYIAADPLATGHTYTTTFSGVVDGEAYSKTWSFTTE